MTVATKTRHDAATDRAERATAPKPAVAPKDKTAEQLLQLGRSIRSCEEQMAQHWAQMKTSALARVNAAIEAGRHLIKAKSLVTQGNWMAWITEVMGPTAQRTSNLYMRLARHAPAARKLAQDAELGIAAIASHLTQRQRTDRAKPHRMVLDAEVIGATKVKPLPGGLLLQWAERPSGDDSPHTAHVLQMGRDAIAKLLGEYDGGYVLLVPEPSDDGETE